MLTKTRNMIVKIQTEEGDRENRENLPESKMKRD